MVDLSETVMLKFASITSEPRLLEAAILAQQSAVCLEEQFNRTVTLDDRSHHHLREVA
jgi:hypothetical protein